MVNSLQGVALQLWAAAVAAFFFAGARAQDQLAASLNSTVSFLDSGLTTLGHVSAFLNALFRGRMDCETVCRETLSKARQALHQKRWTAEAFEDNPLRGIGKDALVLVGSGKEKKALEFFSHCSLVYGVEPIVVPCSLYRPLAVTTATVVDCSCQRCTCLLLHERSSRAIKCLVQTLPGGTFKDSLGNHILPSSGCFQNKCHQQQAAAGALQALHLVNNVIVNGDPSAIPTSIALSLMGRTDKVIQGEACVCAPLRPAESDEWSKALKRMSQTKDDASRGAEGVVSRALSRYLQGTPQSEIAEENFGMLESIFPRLIEVGLIIILTVWFRVDGFSSSLVARRAVRDYVTDEIGNATHIGLRVQKVVLVFERLTGYRSQHISHVLIFRSGQFTMVNLTVILGTAASLFSTVWWCVTILGKGWAGNWSSAYSRSPTILRAFVGAGAISACFLLDCVQLWIYNGITMAPPGWRNWLKYLARDEATLLIVMMAELAMTVLVLIGISFPSARKYGRLLYCFLEILSWAKWLVGSIKLGEFIFSKNNEQRSGKWVYASAFLAAAIMAGIGGQWH